MCVQIEAEVEMEMISIKRNMNREREREREKDLIRKLKNMQTPASFLFFSNINFTEKL